MHILVFFFFFFSCLRCPLRLQNSHRPTSERVFWCFETSPLSRLPPQDGCPSLTLLSLFLSSYFVLPPFKENGLPLWVLSVLCQGSEVCFVEAAQHSNDLLMNLRWRKWSPHPIPLPSWDCLPQLKYFYIV